jgi:hypothetical protein
MTRLPARALGLLALALALAPAPARAEFITVTAPISLLEGGTTSVSVPHFDNALGTLTGVSYRVEGTLAYSLVLHNGTGDPVPHVIWSGGAVLAVDRLDPSFWFGRATPTSLASNVPPGDSLRSGSASLFQAQVGPVPGSALGNYTGPVDPQFRVQYLGGGVFVVPPITPGVSISDFNSSVTGRLVVDYEYTPAAPTVATPVPASLVMAFLGMATLAGGGLTRRLRRQSATPSAA